MIEAGIATVFVTDMDRAVDFYTNTLGLKLRMRADNYWAEVVAGDLVIGLHPASPENAAGVRGSIQIGLTVTESLDDAVKELASRGVAFAGPIVDDSAVRLAFFPDPDGNVHYLCEVKTAPST